MSFPPPPAAATAGGMLPLNPIETMLNSLNTNTYLIGMSMILLNLGGRHLSLSLTPEQDRFFQNPWIRRGMLFVVIFVATRNVFTALWLSIGLILTIGYLFNEHSSLYLLGTPIPLPPQPAAPAPLPAQVGATLTNEEQEIYKRLHDKVQRAKSAEELKKMEDMESKESSVGNPDELQKWYKNNISDLIIMIY
jgi:hypothetical protein